MRPSVLFIKEQVIKDRSAVTDGVDGKLLRQVILKVQEEQIHPMLGTALYNRLQTGVSGSTLTANETTLLNNYITNIMLYYVCSELPMVLGYKFYNTNVLKRTTENADQLTMEEMAGLIKYYQNAAEFQKERTIRYLRQNATSSVFPEYLNPGDGEDVLLPERRGYTCPFVLDDSHDRPNGYDYDRNDL